MMKTMERATGRRTLLALVLLVATTVAPLARAADARHVTIGAQSGPAVSQGGDVPGDETQRWWGVAGAVICGIEIRLVVRVPAIGMNPYAIAAGLAGCSLALLDVLTTQ